MIGTCPLTDIAICLEFRIGDRLNTLMTGYHAETSRVSRLAFITKLINNDMVDREITSVELKISHRFKPLRRPYKLEEEDWKRYGHISSPAARHERFYHDEYLQTVDVSPVKEDTTPKKDQHVHYEKSQKWANVKQRLLAINRFQGLKYHQW